jgi:hypothetical protein
MENRSKMKTISKAWLGILFLIIAVVPLQAQTEADTKAKDEPAAVAKDRPAGNESVRIDQTGIHVGGDEPVDIKLPNFGSEGSFLGPLLPIIGVIAPFATFIGVIALFVFLRHRRNRMMHETLRTMVEKGVPIPPELLRGGGAFPAGSYGAVHPHRDLRSGLVLIALGAGLWIMAGKVGLIPVFIGAALMIVWLVGLLTNKGKNTPAQ